MSPSTIPVLTAAVAVAASACGGADAPAPSEPFDRPPLFVTGDTTVHHNEPFALRVIATDPDGDAVTVTALDLPNWTVFDPVAAQLSGEPGLDQVGDHPIRLRASAGTLTTEGELVLTVGNRTPAFNPVHVRDTEYDSLYWFAVRPFDPDGDPISVDLERIPAWASYDSVDGIVSGIPGWDNIGTRHGVLFRVTDGLATNTLAFDVEVVRPTLVCTGSWTAGWPQVCHDGRAIESEHFRTFSEASSPDARRAATDVAEVALADAMVRTETIWDDFTFNPAYDEPLIHLMLDYGQMNQSGLAYPHGAIMRAIDSPRFLQFYTPERWRDVLQHELTHVIEFLLIGDPRYWFVHATWLREGFASWGARLTTVTTVEQLDAWRGQMAGLEGGGNPIGINRFADMPASIRNANQTILYYPFFELATRYLLDPDGHGTGIDDLKGMFEDIENGTAWDAAFEKAFGMTAAYYEANFWSLAEAYLRR